MRVLFFLLPLLAACADLPPPVNPEFQQAGGYRNLATVPPRPEVTVPLGQRMQWQDELKAKNAAARQAQHDAGLDIPAEAPAPPQELPQ